MLVRHSFEINDVHSEDAKRSLASFLVTDGSQVIVSRDRIQELESLVQLQKHEVSHTPQSQIS